MRKTGFSLLILLVGILGFAGATLAQDDDANLLVNPGFEQPYNEVEGVLQPLSVADGWTAWQTLSDIEEPFFNATSIENPDRVLSGSDAQKYAAFASVHLGGVYQTVSGIESGTPLAFSAYVYVWSSADGVDADESIDPGLVTVEVGIDPTGGTDPDSEAIIWSEPVEVYDEYQQHTVYAAAEADSVTVFVRTVQAEMRLLTEVYLDDAALVVIDALPEPDTVQPEATSDLSAPATDDVTVTEEAVATEDVIVTEEAPVIETTEEAVVTEEISLPTEEVIVTEEVVLPTEEVVITEEALPTEAVIVNEEVIVTEEVTPEATPTEFVMPTQDVTVLQTQDAELLATNSALVSTVQADLAVQTQAAINATLETENLMGTATAVIAQATAFHETQVAAQPTQVTVVIEPTATPFVLTATPTTEAEVVATEEAVVTEEVATGETDVTEEATAEITETTPEAIVTPFSEEFPSHILHTVNYGENVAFLAMYYNSSTQAIIAANGLNENALIYIGQGLMIPVRVPPVENTPTPEAPVEDQYYVVQRGDMLSRIAQRFNTTTTTLAQLNGIVNVNSIRVGQKLLLPSGSGEPVPPTEAAPTPEPVTYVVQRGDSLYLIAIKYDVTIQSLVDANQLANPHRLFVGQVLVIP